MICMPPPTRLTNPSGWAHFGAVAGPPRLVDSTFSLNGKDTMPKRLLNGKQVFWSYCVMAVGALVVNKYYDAGGLGQLPPLVHWFYVVVFGFSVYAARYLFRGEQRIRALLDHGVFFTALVGFVIVFFVKESQDLVIRAQSMVLVGMVVSGYYVCQHHWSKETGESTGEHSPDD